MPRLRNIALLASWAGLVWMLLARAAHRPLVDNFLFDLAYNIALVAVAVMVAVTGLAAARRLFHPPAAIQLGLAALLILGVAAVDVFWLRGLFGAA